jgi:hypothetical protein
MRSSDGPAKRPTNYTISCSRRSTPMSGSNCSRTNSAGSICRNTISMVRFPTYPSGNSCVPREFQTARLSRVMRRPVSIVGLGRPSARSRPVCARQKPNARPCRVGRHDNAQQVGGVSDISSDSPVEEAGFELFVPLRISASPSWRSRARKPDGAPEESFSVARPLVRIHLPPAASPCRTQTRPLQVENPQKSHNARHRCAGGSHDETAAERAQPGLPERGLNLEAIDRLDLCEQKRSAWQRLLCRPVRR